MLWTHLLSCGVPGGGCETLVWTVKHVGDVGTSWLRIRGLGAEEFVDKIGRGCADVIKAHQ